MRVTMMLGLLLSVLSTTQRFCIGFHTETSYRQSQNTAGFLKLIIFTRAVPEFKRACIRFSVCRKETLRLTLNEETNVDHPYAHRKHYNDSIFVPNGDTSVGRKQSNMKDRET